MYNIIRALWGERVAYFWPIWITITFVAMSVTWMISRARIPTSWSAATALGNGSLAPGFGRSRRAITALALALLALFLLGYVTVSMLTEKFAFYDDIQFTLYSLKGFSYPPPIWRPQGRFFPLGMQEFNLLMHVTRSVAGFHVLLIAQILILSCALLTVDRELNIAGRAALVPIFLCAPGIVIAFTGLIYPERNFVFCLVFLVLFVERFERTGAPGWAAAAAASAQIMIYEKETASLLLLAFTFSRLLLRWWNARRAGNYNGWLSSKGSRLDLCLASLAALFLLYYFAVMYPHPNMKYADRTHLPLGEALRSYLKLDFLAWLFAVVVLVRVYGIFRKKLAPSLLWDSLGIGGLVCFAAYLRLGIFRAYYLAPVEAIAVLYVGRWAILSWKEMRAGSRAMALGLACLVVIQYVSLSSFHILERQNMLRAKAEIARVVGERYLGATRPVRLFFPYASSWQVMEFGYDLNLHGIPVESDTTTGQDGRSPLVLVAKSVAKDGRCQEYWRIVCRAGPAPQPGDLVIVLPDDNVWMSQVAPYQEGGESLLSYERRPALPGGFYPLIRLLAVASVPVAQKNLPDHWMDASVTLWR